MVTLPRPQRARRIHTPHGIFYGINSDDGGNIPGLAAQWHRGARLVSGHKLPELCSILQRKADGTNSVLLLTQGQVYDLIDALNRMIEDI